MTSESEAAIRRLIDALKTAQPHIDVLAHRAAMQGDSVAYDLLGALERAAEKMVEEMYYDRNAFEFLYHDTRRSKATAD